MRWSIAGAPIDRPRELLARLRVATVCERAWCARRCERIAPRTSPMCSRRERRDGGPRRPGPGRVRRAAVWLLPRGGAGRAGAVRSTHAGGALLLELQRAVHQRGAWPLLRVELAGRPRASTPRRGDRHLDGVRAARAGGGRARGLPHQRSRRRATLALWPGSIPSGSPASRAHAAPMREVSARHALVRDDVADRGARPAGGHEPLGLHRVRTRARCSWTGRTRWRPGASCAVPGAARSSACDGAGASPRGRGDRPAPRRGGRTWMNSDGRRNMPSGEVFTGPREDSARGPVAFTMPSSPSGVRGGRASS